MSPHRRRWLWRFLALLLGLVGAGGLLVWAEVRQRSLEGKEWIPVTDPPGIKYALAPTARRPPRGWVEGVPPDARTPGKKRIICVGDSVTWGLKVAAEEAWPAVLATLLGRDRVEVYNFGVVGYDVEQSAALLEGRIGPWLPDLVIWGNFQNDLFPTRILRGTEGKDLVYVGTEVPEGIRILPEGPSRFMLAHSALFRHLQGARLARAMEAHTDLRTPPDWYRDNVARIRDWALEHGVPLLVLAIPTHILTNEAACAKYLDDTPGACERLAIQYGLITSALDELQLQWLDGLAIYRAGGMMDYLNPDEPGDHQHPNPAGHQALAAALAGKVSDLLGLAAVQSGNQQPSVP